MAFISHNESCRNTMAWQMAVASANKPVHPLHNNVGLLSFWRPVVAWTKNPMTAWMNERKCIITKRCPPQGRRHLRTYWNHIQLWKMPHFAIKKIWKLKQENTVRGWCKVLLNCIFKIHTQNNKPFHSLSFILHSVDKSSSTILAIIYVPAFKPVFWGQSRAFLALFLTI